MKKILLHIGYPKTATTTLQEEVFLKLHELGRINYLSRTVKSTHTKTGISRFDGIDWVWHLRRHLVSKQVLKYDSSVLSDDLLNVISDEDLTFHDFFHFAHFGNQIENRDFPQQLKHIFGNDVDIKILLSIRNQTDLIFSSYLQKFKYLKRYVGDISFTNFLFNSHGYKNRSVEEHLALYNFNKLKSLWYNVFFAEFDILFFEDLSKDNQAYISTLSKLLPASKDEIKSMILSKHHRKKDKAKNGFTISYEKLTSLGKLISNFYADDSFERLLEMRYHMQFSILKKYEKQLLYKKLEQHIPLPTNEEIDFIKSFFRESNIEFSKSMNLDINKMKKYNYL